MPPDERPIPDWPGWNDREPGIEPLLAILPKLADLDGPADEQGGWPEALWRELVAVDAHRWILSPELGGLGLDAPSVLRRYGKLAEASLTAVFLLSQHDAALRRLMARPGSPAIAGLLRQTAIDGSYLTVGISHLTTSTRLGTNAMRLKPEPGGGYSLTGTMPWVTGAVRARAFVTGGVLDDGNQLLVLLPADRPGVRVQPALPLAALQASCTCEVHCDEARVSADEVIVGPMPSVMKIPGLAGTGGLETSALALGQARVALSGLSQVGTDPSHGESAQAMGGEWLALARDMLRTLDAGPDATPAGEIRRQANALVLRATQSYLMARKGSGFVRTDSAQRWARQALFFLVWSCPSAVAQAAIRDLAGLCPLS